MAPAAKWDPTFATRRNTTQLQLLGDHPALPGASESSASVSGECPVPRVARRPLATRLVPLLALLSPHAGNHLVS